MDGEKQGRTEGKSLGFQISLKFKSWLYHLLPMWPWGSGLISSVKWKELCVCVCLVNERCPAQRLVTVGLQQMVVVCACAQSYCTLCDPTDQSLPGSSVHGILQARILEWVAMPSSRGSSQLRDQTCVSCFAGGFFTAEPPGKANRCYNSINAAQVCRISPDLGSLIWPFFFFFGV